MSEACCEIHPPKEPPGHRPACPRCGTPGKTVGRITLGALLKPEARAKMPPAEAFRFCGSPACGTVYFSEGKQLFEKTDLSVAVHQKEPDNPAVPVCYCFGWTPRKIRTQMEETGKSTAAEEIKAQVKAGNCYCEVTNPQGACCLGNVAGVIQRLKG